MTERSVTQQQFHDQLIGRTFKCVDDARRAVGISAGTPFRFMIVLKNMGFAATYPEIGVCKIVEI